MENRPPFGDIVIAIEHVREARLINRIRDDWNRRYGVVVPNKVGDLNSLCSNLMSVIANPFWGRIHPPEAYKSLLGIADLTEHSSETDPASDAYRYTISAILSLHGLPSPIPDEILNAAVSMTSVMREHSAIGKPILWKCPDTIEALSILDTADRFISSNNKDSQQAKAFHNWPKAVAAFGSHWSGEKTDFKALRSSLEFLSTIRNSDFMKNLDAQSTFILSHLSQECVQALYDLPIQSNSPSQWWLPEVESVALKDLTHHLGRPPTKEEVEKVKRESIEHYETIDDAWFSYLTCPEARNLVYTEAAQLQSLLEMSMLNRSDDLDHALTRKITAAEISITSGLYRERIATSGEDSLRSLLNTSSEPAN